MADRDLAVIVVVLLAMFAAGCTSSAVGIHARAVVAVASAHAAAGGELDAARSAALDAVEAEHPTAGDERTAALRAEGARWRPIGAALDAARGALATWLQSVELAEAAGGGEDLLLDLARLAARVAELYGSIVELARGVGVDDLPPIPAALAAVLSGIGGES